jgi:hypothetical protein
MGLNSGHADQNGSQLSVILSLPVIVLLPVIISCSIIKKLAAPNACGLFFDDLALGLSGRRIAVIVLVGVIPGFLLFLALPAACIILRRGQARHKSSCVSEEQSSGTD